MDEPFAPMILAALTVPGPGVPEACALTHLLEHVIQGGQLGVAPIELSRNPDEIPSLGPYAQLDRNDEKGCREDGSYKEGKEDQDIPDVVGGRQEM